MGNDARTDALGALPLGERIRFYRRRLGLSQKDSAELIGRSVRWWQDVERGTAVPRVADLAAIADLLKTTIPQIAGEDFAAVPADKNAATELRSRPSSSTGDAAGLIIEHEFAQLRYENGLYHTTQRRLLVNPGDSPVTRFLVRISVDRHPGESARSNRLYRQDPLTWGELNFAAHCEGEPMMWTVKHDRDSFKELYLRFESPDGRHFPIYPGRSAWIEYTYTVGDDKWGQWYQRAVRWPTRHLMVELVFPSGVEPAVWGTETSLSGEAIPLRTPIQQRAAESNAIFEWTIDDPPLATRYRFEWRFQGQKSMERLAEMEASKRMQAIGIRQEGDPVLHESCRPFDLPAEEAEAQSIITRLIETADQATKLHRFTKGVGLAAPQIGLPRAATVVWFPDQDPLVLLNPRIVGQSDEQDEQYEGCLSFFDVRGMVPRPLMLEVEYTSLDGTQRIITFERGMARLVAHELDHLQGILYTERMLSDQKLIPVSEYRGTGTAWQY